MAKENYIFLIGQVKRAPIIKFGQDGQPVKASFVLTTIKRKPYDNAGMYSPKYDYPYIETQDENVIRIIQNIKPFDFIEVKGTFATKNILRGKKCPQCEHMTIEKGVLDYIEPLYVGIRAHANSGNDGADYLRQCSEASNILKAIGKVCNDPTFYCYDNGTGYSNYNLAINRKVFVSGQPEVSADFPWVKTYGTQAEKDRDALQLGSLVYIDGYIKTEKATQKTKCEACGHEFDFEYITMVIRPHAVEYLEGCHLPDPEVQEIKDLVDD